MKTIAILSYLISVSIVISWGQQMKPNFSIDDMTHDFGEIADNEVAIHTFSFTNSGSQPLIINNIRASCGCTTPEWSKEPIVPGAKGFIKVKFDPKGRSGPFDKSVTVHTNSDPSVTVLRISGNINITEKPIEQIYKYQMGDIRLQSTMLHFSKINHDETKTTSINIINVSDKEVTLIFKNMPSGLHLESVPKTLKPMEKGQILATYNVSNSNEWGVVNHLVSFSYDGNPYNQKLHIRAYIKEDFNNLTEEELEKAPRISLSEPEYDFGNVKQGEQVEHHFKISNEGKSNLIIRKINASCGCTAVKPEKNIIAPGETTNIKVRFNSSGRKGQQRKSITIISNDPENFEKTLYLKGNVDA